MTTTEIYYNKGYEKGKAEVVKKIRGVMDKMNKLYGTKNRLYSNDWNVGYDAALSAIFAELDLATREV